MSTNVLTVRTVAAATPRGARWAAEAFAAVIGLFRSAVRERAPVGGTAQEAAALREYANTIARTDPSFAADLYAAADRHEVTSGR